MTAVSPAGGKVGRRTANAPPGKAGGPPGGNPPPGEAGGRPPAGNAPPGDAGGRLGGVARGGLAGMAGAAFAGLSGLAVTWLVARTLGPQRAGVFFAATAVFVLAGAFAKLGAETGLVYWTARLRALGRPDLLRVVLRAGLAPVTVAAAALGVALLLAAGPLARLTAGDADPATVGQHAAALRLVAPVLPLAAFADTALAATRGYRQIRPTVLLDRFARPALQLGGVAVLVVVGLATVTPPQAYVALWAAPYLPVALLAGYALRRAHRAATAAAIGRAPSPARSDKKGPFLTAKRFWGFTAPRAVASAAQLALQRVDVLLVSALAGLGPAALYAVAGRFVVLGQFANQGISQAVQPRLAESLALGDRAAARRLYQTATGWLVLTTWPLYLLVIGYAPAYLGLFGDAYRAGASVVVVLAAAMLVASGCGMVDMVLAMGGRTRWNLINVGVALAVSVALQVALIPRWGALGGAVGLGAALLVNNLLPLAQVRHLLGLHPFGRGTLTAATLAIACFAVLPRLVAPLFGTGLPALAGTLALCLPAYLAGAHRLRRPLALDAFTAPRATAPAPI